jgi:hypothetical protein
MPSSPSVPTPQSSPGPRVETAHDHAFVTAAAETPEQAQLGTPSGPALLRGHQRSATLESILDDLDRHMTENTASNDTPRPSTRRIANTPIRVRGAAPDPVIAAPNAPRVAVPPSPTVNPQNLSIAGRVLVFFGYGRNNRARKELVSLISSLVVDASQVRHIVGCPAFYARFTGRTVQIIAIITFLTISTHRRSPTDPSENEWNACGKPLGTWDALWIVRLSLDIWLSLWRWSRERTKRLQDER